MSVFLITGITDHGYPFKKYTGYLMIVTLIKDKPRGVVGLLLSSMPLGHPGPIGCFYCST